MRVSFGSTPYVNTQRWVFIVSFSLSSMYPLLCYGNYDAEWNPTGNPIGGDPGYDEVMASWNYYVTTEQNLSQHI
jgi:hypothetical protein